MKLEMNSIIYFHVIILITKENCTLKKSLGTDLILWNSRKLWLLIVHSSLSLRFSLTCKLHCTPFFHYRVLIKTFSVWTHIFLLWFVFLYRKNEIEDEFHYLFSCDNFNNQRKLYIKENFRNRPNTRKFKEIVISKRKKKLCRFVAIINTGRWITCVMVITGFVTRLTRRVPLVKQELLNLPEHLSSPPVLIGVRVTRSLVLYVCFLDRCLFFVLFLAMS
jgi:hypothetical protein